MRRIAPLLVCSVLGLTAAWQMYALPDAPGEPPLTFAQCLLWRWLPWQAWLVWMPLIVLLRRRFPSTTRGLLASLPVHLLFYAAIVVAQERLVHACGTLAGLEPYISWSFMEMVPNILIKGSLLPLAMYAAVLVGDAAFEYRRRYREADERLAQAQLSALKMQLHPHFLFNTLNSIAVLVRKNDGPLALEILDGLAELLRYSLRTMKVEHVPLRDEIAFVRRYLAIHRVRFSDRLEVAIDVDPEVEAARIPSLVTQPIVENAIKHGVARRAGTSRVEIRVRAVRVAGGERLRVEVRDDGPGPDAAPLPASERNGLGLAHVRERLAQLYPGRHQVALETRDDGGTTAILEIPLERGSEAA
jgi:two-component system LytT family sensor kinase